MNYIVTVIYSLKLCKPYHMSAGNCNSNSRLRWNLRWDRQRKWGLIAKYQKALRSP